MEFLFLRSRTFELLVVNRPATVLPIESQQPPVTEHAKQQMIELIRGLIRESHRENY